MYKNSNSDPTKILIDNYTEEQKLAQIFIKNQELQSVSSTCKLKLALIIPYKDKPELTKSCLQSIAKQTKNNYELTVLLIDNSSINVATKEIISEQMFILQQENITVRSICCDFSFNFSKLNNVGVRSLLDTNPELLLFLNNDVEFTNPNSLDKIASFMQSHPSCGALGCTLLYPNQKIQHLFLAPGVKIAGAHPLKNLIYNQKNSWFSLPARPVPAVTGAALAVKTKDFLTVNGFNEKLAYACQDLDLCLKLQKNGLINWVLPQVILIHHESASRPCSFNSEEISYFYTKWGSKLFTNKFYSPKFSRWSEWPLLAWFEGKYPWKYLIK